MPRTGPEIVGEAARLALLKRLEILDTAPERAFDDIAQLAGDVAGAPIALISLVDEARQWFKAKIGLEAPETPRSQAFCDHAIRADDVLWVQDARTDPRFAENPLVLGAPGIRFYAGAPITVAGQRIGTVCVIAPEPRPFDQLTAMRLTRLAGLAADECAQRLMIKELSEAREKAAAASEAKSRFLANMSHELRTPLNGVVGMASVLSTAVEEPRFQEMVEIIQSSSRTLASLLDDVLDLSRIEAGRVDLQLYAFRLDVLVGQVLALFRLRASEKGLRLSASGAPERSYLGDAGRIRQILTNLVSNAVKFTEAGSVTIEVQARPGADGDHLAVSVVDTGPGFTAEVSERLFSRFEQGDASVTRRHGGSGLGLAISRGLAELMGGALEATSVPGQGARFTLQLDLQHAQEEPADAAEAAAEAFDHAGLRVLVADDHPVNRRVVELILQASGVDCTTVTDGRAAIEACATGRFDLVLMDVQMPELDGLEAIRRIRAHEAATGAPRTQIFTLSAHAMTDHIRQSLEAGADDHLTKPIRADQLTAALARVGAVLTPASARRLPPAAR